MTFYKDSYLGYRMSHIIIVMVMPALKVLVPSQCEGYKDFGEFCFRPTGGPISSVLISWLLLLEWLSELQ